MASGKNNRVLVAAMTSLWALALGAYGFGFVVLKIHLNDMHEMNSLCSDIKERLVRVEAKQEHIEQSIEENHTETKQRLDKIEDKL